MANTYKNIVITPNRGSSNDDPKIVFSGANTSANTDVTLKVYPDSNGTLSFEGSAGQLFSITNDLTGSIFSVNDVSGLPIIDVNANSSTSIIGRSFLSNMAPALSVTDTWANGSLNFTAVKANVTNTNSGSGSLLMDLQVGGTSWFYVGKTGVVSAPNILGMSAFEVYSTDADARSRIGSNRHTIIDIYSVRTNAGGGALGFGPTGMDVYNSVDVVLRRDSGNTLAQRYGTYPQTFRLYGTYTDASNYERLAFFANSTAAYIQTENAGTGIARSLRLGANNSTAVTIDANGNVGIANTAPEARLHVYGANNASTALKVTTRGSDDGATRKGVEVVPSSGPNSTYYAFYADVTNHSANYGLYINNGRAYIKDLTDMLGNARITGVRDSNYGTLQIGDTTSGFSAGLGGRITFWGDTVGQGSARNAFAGIRGVKENSSYLNSLGTLVFETQTNTDGDGTTLTEKMRITSGGNVGIGTTSPATQFHQKSLSANNYNNKIFRIDSNTDSRIATVTGDGRVFIGSDNGYNVVFSVDNKGEKKDSSYTMLIKDSYNLLMTSSGFVTDSPNFSLGANNFGATIEFVSPAQNGMLTINKANTSIGRGNQSGTPDKTLRVYTQLSLPTTFRVQESDSQGSVESFGVYANNDSTARLVVANGRVGVGTSSPSYLFHLSSSSTSPSGDIARFESPVTSGGFTTVSFRHNVSGGADVTTAIGADGSKGWVGTTSNTDFALFSNFTEKMRITSGGNVGIGTTTPTALLDANTDIIRIRTSKTPASATATGNQGDICWDSNYIYVCTAANTWVRANLSTW